MILVDYRERPQDGYELRDLLKRNGVSAQTEKLTFGDLAFEGKGPGGSNIFVGIERKRLGDMNGCIEDARFSEHQRIGMSKIYDYSILLLEGLWRPNDRDGIIMEGDVHGRWWPWRPFGRTIPYAKLRRYLFSIQLAGVMVLYTRDIVQTAYDACELYQYFQKPWDRHSSHLEAQKLNIATLNDRPTLTRMWAESIDGVGQVHGRAAAKFFKSPQELANSSEMEWMAIDGIGPKRAKSIMAQIEGRKV